jgi:hypothetical protein
MRDARLAGELAREQPLPPLAVPGGRRVVEHEEVAPVVGRIAGGAHHEVAVAALDDTIGRQDVDAGGPHQ